MLKNISKIWCSSGDIVNSSAPKQGREVGLGVGEIKKDGECGYRREGFSWRGALNGKYLIKWSKCTVCIV